MVVQDQKRPKIALITGATRGLGLATAHELARRSHHVILTGRDELEGQTATKEIQQDGHNAEFQKLDVQIDEDLEKICRFLKAQERMPDILINNAAWNPERPSLPEVPDFFDVKSDSWKKTLDVNLVGPVRLIHAFLPEMMNRNYGRIVNVSSGLGRVVEASGQAICYSTSKAALNFLTRTVAKRVDGYDILINAVCPGWVQTDMGGEHAVRNIEQGVSGIVEAAGLDAKGKSGVLLRDGEDFGW